jgi:hypothetical protein
VDSTHIQSSVDELYRLALGLERTLPPVTDSSKAWKVDTYKGVTRHAAYATPDGKRAAFVRLPDRHATIVILTNDANADVKAMSEKLLDQLLAGR